MYLSKIFNALSICLRKVLLFFGNYNFICKKTRKGLTCLGLYLFIMSQLRTNPYAYAITHSPFSQKKLNMVIVCSLVICCFIIIFGNGATRLGPVSVPICIVELFFLVTQNKCKHTKFDITTSHAHQGETRELKPRLRSVNVLPAGVTKKCKQENGILIPT